MNATTAALVEQLESLTTDQPMTPAREGQTPRPTLPLKYHQVEAYTDELRRLGDFATGGPRDLDGQRWRENMGGDRTVATKRAREIRKILDTQAPKPITGPRANQVYGLVKALRDEVFRPALLPTATEHRVPSGTVGHLQRTVFTPGWNRAAVAFKRAIRALDPENPDPDLANIDRFRPRHDGPAGAAIFDVDAVIPGNFAFGAAAKANWPLGEPTADTALKQAERAAESVTPTNGHTRRPRKAPREKRPASAAQLAALEKAHAARRAKRAAAEATGA